MATQTTTAKSAFQTFIEYRKTEATRISYRQGIRDILGENPDAFLKLALRDKRKAEEYLMAYVIKRRGTLSSNSLSVYLAQAKSFLDFNEVSLNWKKIKGGAPSASYVALDRPPTVEEIRKALKEARMRERLVILVMASSGCRVGAFAFLNVGDLVPLESGIGALRVYGGEPEEYQTFVSRECVQAFLEYVEARKKFAQEEVTPESPLIRNYWETQTEGRTTKNPAAAERLNVSSIQGQLFRVWIKAGVRVNEHGDGAPRKAFKSAHGFRKFAKTQLSKAGLKWEDTEVILGHRLNYYKPAAEHLEAEYLRAQPFVLISEAEEQKVRREADNKAHEEEIEKVSNDVRIERDERRTLQERVEKMEALIAEMAERERRRSLASASGNLG